MHADFHTLSAIAAGRGEPSEHVRGCSHCQRELGRIRAVADGLAALPAVEPRPGLWHAIEARAARQPARSPVPLALAAAAMLVVVAGSLVRVLTEAPIVTSDPAPAAAAHGAIAALVAENARLEALLTQLPQRSTTRLGTAYGAIALEDRLALLDDRLTEVSFEPHAPEVAEQLWQERVALMDSLVKIRYAGAVADR